MSFSRRREPWGLATAGGAFDVAVIGGGINGAAAYDALCRRGFRVCLLERDDFAGGTSQASAMMVWGGLLYLAQLDLATVRSFCRSRDQMLRELPEWIHLAPNRYVFVAGHGRGPGTLAPALGLYWALGAFRRARPRLERSFPERSFLLGDGIRTSLRYEEAAVEPSDARFVQRWILAHRGVHHVALNHCAVEGGGFDASRSEWRLEIADRLTGAEGVARARWIVNAAGCWADSLNQRFGIRSPWRHVFGKGVFVALPRYPGHESPLTFENREGGDCMSLIPWGPVSLWGPTETRVDDLEAGYHVEPEDVRFLLDEWNRHAARPVGPSDVVSLRCGVRPLAQRTGRESEGGTLSISRRHRVVTDDARRWTTLYGGKITGCTLLGREVGTRLAARLRPTGVPSAGAPVARPPCSERFPGLEQPVLSTRWAAEQEQCFTLDDYLRRRTNISQWVPRMGLGRSGEFAAAVRALAQAFPGASGATPDHAAWAYGERVQRELDAVLAAV